MSELRIVRGADVALYVGETPLFGVTALHAVEKKKYHEVYEYLSAAPYERIPQGSSYEIQLSMMALFDRQLPEEESFTLRIVDSDTACCYDNCRVTDRKTVVKGKGSAVEVFTLRADKMRKQVSDE